MDNRDRLIVAQVAYKAAVDAGIKDPDEIHIFAQDIFDGVMQLAGGKPSPTFVAAIETAFPGAQVVQDDDDEALSAEPPFQPDTKVPAEVKANKRWAVATLRADIDNKVFFKSWWDNSETAAGTRRPILKHKDTSIALWPEDVDGISIPKSKFSK
jgi:hypothetical protein